MRSELRRNSVLLHSEISGEGQYPVVLLHGMFGSASNLISVARALEPDFKVIRMDLRNQGKSPHRDAMTISLMTDDVIHTLDELNIARAHFLGHSLGGKVAMDLAVRFPERVAKVVVADIAPVRYGRGHDAILDGLLGMDMQALRSRQQADEILAKSVPELPIRQFLLKNLMRDGDSWAWKMNLSAIAENYDHLRDAPDSGNFDGPILFIRGGSSGYIREENRVGIMRQFPDARIETIADAGHWLHAEYPQIFNEMTRGFLLEE
ncbi:alpha/beta fold hydrolase [Spongiibacter sp. KMU-158]|uniref:Alpha/beta fold hydrolase n=1 Tax=Spongiibacter pelagi TaxID=2760804 RepID=A0A927BZI2_9GAMM|nr:alpha/beta fold hydrolase [Spongiibacter pelagi]MBD2858464.1 alpha/beta fold hydrolase [Spongiibacter pelagi]